MNPNTTSETDNPLLSGALGKGWVRWITRMAYRKGFIPDFRKTVGQG
jgi:hypothetical protein